MKFISEYASEDNINKFKLNELLNKYQNTTASYNHNWIIGEQTNSWLLPVKQVNSYESIWIFHYKDTNIEIKLYRADEGFDLTSITSNPFDNKEIIYSLQEALKVLGTNDIVYATLKITQAKEIKDTKVIATKKLKRKRTNLAIFIAIIIIQLVYFIAKDSDGVEVSDPNETHITKKVLKNQQLKSVSHLNNNFISDTKVQKTRPKVVTIKDKVDDNLKLNRCLACHGRDWSKPALGKSAIVKNMSQENIAKALKGYKNGTYGSSLKGIMEGQIRRYTDKELDTIAKIIKTQ